MKSEDPEELEYYWTQWHDKAGTPVRSLFDKYIGLNKEAAVLNSRCIWLQIGRDVSQSTYIPPHLDFTSGAEMWLDEYEDSTFEQQLENIFEEIRPLYQQLHAYVRHALRAKYGDLVTETGPIPMHLLGNMWAQSWDSVRAWLIRFKLWNQIHCFHCSQIAKFTAPFPGKRSADVTDEMVRQNITAVKMFQMGDQFFQSLNFTALPE